MHTSDGASIVGIVTFLIVSGLGIMAKNPWRKNKRIAVWRKIAKVVNKRMNVYHDKDQLNLPRLATNQKLTKINQTKMTRKRSFRWVIYGWVFGASFWIVEINILQFNNILKIIKISTDSTCFDLLQSDGVAYLCIIDAFFLTLISCTVWRILFFSYFSCLHWTPVACRN